MASLLYAHAYGNRYARISAYERKLKEENREFSKDKNNEVIGMTPLAFSDFASKAIKASMEYSSLNFWLFLDLSLISLVELLMVGKLMKKERYNKIASE